MHRAYDNALLSHAHRIFNHLLLRCAYRYREEKHVHVMKRYQNFSPTCPFLSAFYVVTESLVDCFLRFTERPLPGTTQQRTACTAAPARNPPQFL